MRADTKKEHILVPLAEGFEEVEAIAVIDVLRRAELDVTVAGLRPGFVKGSHGIAVQPDADLGQLDLARFTVIVLPGGMPGTRNLMKDERVLGLVRRLKAEGRTTAAICAAPLVLRAAGVLGDAPITSHPSVRDELGDAVLRGDARVLTSGSIVTSQGPGTALEFALALVERFAGAAEARRLASSMLVRAEPAAAAR
jgi:4-methyl-5(b-hydroxyethyl)-thiazole monophosphate biosynthesis